jgi:hypothetical protein
MSFETEARLAKMSTQANEAARRPLGNFQLFIGAVAVVAAVSVVAASQRITERAIVKAVEEREAAARFLASELSVLRMMALTSERPVAARLYLGIEECFKARMPVPFDPEQAPEAKKLLAECGEIELGRLYSQGGGAMANDGRQVLQQAGVFGGKL